MKILCCILACMAIQHPNFGYSQNNANASQNASRGSANPQDYSQEQIYPPKVEKNNQAKHVITSVALFGIAAIALAFVSHNSD